MARQQLELIWQSLMMQSRENGLSNLSFPIQQLSGLDNDGLSELLTRFRYVVLIWELLIQLTRLVLLPVARQPSISTVKRSTSQAPQQT